LKNKLFLTYIDSLLLSVALCTVGSFKELLKQLVTVYLVAKCPTR